MKNFFKTIRKNKFCYLYLAPFFILFGIFVIAPVVMAIILSFTSYNLTQPPQFVGIANYTALFFSDTVFTKATVNTLTMAIVVGPFSYIGALILAWALNELSPKLRTALVFFIYAPSISGNAFIIWQLLFSGDQFGYINSLLLNWGFISEPIYFLFDTKYMMTVVIIVTMWMSMGTQFLSFVAGLQGLDHALFEAGCIDGIRNRWQELWFITLPQLKPQLMFGAVMSITGAFTVGNVGAMLCGNPSTEYAVHTLVNHMTDYATVKYEFGYACAIATLLFLAMIVCNELIKLLLKNVGR
ncbi:MAG: carbohydrate ABC transporter permease [Acutalibacteraceae bacterium]